MKSSDYTLHQCRRGQPRDPTARISTWSQGNGTSHLLPTDTLLLPGVRRETPGQCASPGSCSGTGWPHPSHVRKVPPPQGWGSTLRALAAIWGGMLPYPSSTRTQTSCASCGAMLLTQHGGIVLLPALKTQGCNSLPTQGTGQSSPTPAHRTQGRTSHPSGLDRMELNIGDGREHFHTSTPGRESPPCQPAPQMAPSLSRWDAAPALHGGWCRMPPPAPQQVQEGGAGSHSTSAKREAELTLSHAALLKHKSPFSPPLPPPRLPVTSSLSLRTSPPVHSPTLSWCSRGASGCPREWVVTQGRGGGGCVIPACGGTWQGTKGWSCLWCRESLAHSSALLLPSL